MFKQTYEMSFLGKLKMFSEFVPNCASFLMYFRDFFLTDAEMVGKSTASGGVTEKSRTDSDQALDDCARAVR